MASITVINKTNTIIHSALTVSAIHSSVRNLCSPGEFHVHGAGGIHDLSARYHSGPTSLYRVHEEPLELPGEIVIDLRSVVLVGDAGRQGAAVFQGLAGPGNVMLVDQTVVSALGGAPLAARSLRASDVPGDARWANISGQSDRVFVIEGGLDATAPNAAGAIHVTFRPLTIREIGREEFVAMQRSRQIYEVSPHGQPVWVDGNGARYYVDDHGNHVFNPGGDEYFIARGQRVNVPPNRLSRTSRYTNTTTSASLAMNPDGRWEPPIFTPGTSDRVAQIDGIEVRNQPGHGLINLRLLHGTNHRTTWVRDWMGNADNFSGRFAGSRIHKVEVVEEGGYGITDLRFMTETGEQSGWLAGNAERDPKNPNALLKGRLLTYNVPAGKVLVGIVGKEQDKYGLVDLKFVLHDAPA